jgi:hypothetical protein
MEKALRQGLSPQAFAPGFVNRDSGCLATVEMSHQEKKCETNYCRITRQKMDPWAEISQYS